MAVQFEQVTLDGRTTGGDNVVECHSAWVLRAVRARSRSRRVLCHKAASVRLLRSEL